MKLNVTILPLLVFGLFGYAVVTLEKATDGAKVPVTYEAVKEEIDADIDDLEEAYKESKAIYKFND